MKNALFLALLLVISTFALAQSVHSLEEIKKQPQYNETALFDMQCIIGSGEEYDLYENNRGQWYYTRHINTFIQKTDKQLSEYLIKRVNAASDSVNMFMHLRDFETELRKEYSESNRFSIITGKQNIYDYKYIVNATIVVDTKVLVYKKLPSAIDKALQNIEKGSKLALDKISIESGEEDDVKDRMIEVLLDKGYKVVAKEYFERLFKEQQSQQSGIYNDKTTVGIGNFSAAGYYVNVRITKEHVRVYIINVSTGEYEGNVTEPLM